MALPDNSRQPRLKRIGSSLWRGSDGSENLVLPKA